MSDKIHEIQYYEQLPPQHNLAEEVLLGGILLNSNIIETVVEELISDSFALERHQLIFRTIVDIYGVKKHINSIILINTLWELNLLRRIGGINKILQLLQQAQIFTSKIITSITIKYYIQLIQDKYLRRQLIQYGYDIINLAHNSSVESITIFFKLERYISYIKKQLITKQNTNIKSLLNQVFLNLKSPQTKAPPSELMSDFRSLDRLTGGFKYGDLIIIAGRPSMGKTSLSLNIALKVIKIESKGIIFFSLEMSKEQILYKLLSIESKITTQQIRRGQITTKEWIQLQKTGKTLTESRISIDDNANLSITQIERKAKKLFDEYPNISLLIIDYLQLIQAPTSSLYKRTEELSQITRSLKILAKTLKIPIIALSQLNRNVESRIEKRPLLSDLRESGCLGLQTNVLNYMSYKQFYLNYKKLNQTHSSNNINNVLINNNKNYSITYNQKQYLYHIVKQNQRTSLQLTHNHSLLTHLGWHRVDNLKYFSHLTQLDYYNSTFLCYSITTKIYRANKNNAYDLFANNEKIFFTNDYIIIHNSIEQDADLVLLLFRESYYNQNSSDKNLTELIVAKHRNGPTGTSCLKFTPEISTFTDPEN